MGEHISPDPERNDIANPGRATFAVVPMWLVEALLADTSTAASSTSLRVFVVMQTWADFRTHECWPSQELIADRCSLSGTAVKQAIAMLKRVGALAVTVEAHANGRRNRYRLVFDPPREDEAATRPTRRRSGGKTPDPSDANTPNNEYSSERTNPDSSIPAADPDSSPDAAADTPPRTSGQQAHAVMTGYWSWVTERAGRAPVAIKPPALVVMLIPFFDAGVDVVTVKRALVAMYEDGTTITRAALEKYIDGRTRRGGRPRAASTVEQLAEFRFDAAGNLIE